MTTNTQPMVGIIGGMGIDAGVLLVQKIRELAGASSEQSQPRTILMSDPSVPDRTAFVLGDGPSPVPKLIALSQQLTQAGADVLVMACNTAHSPEILNPVLAASQKPFISIITAVVNQLPAGANRIGVMATNGTLASSVYRTALHLDGKQVVEPSAEQQQTIMDCIYSIKEQGITPQAESSLKAIFESLLQDCDAIILGCTELSLCRLINHPQAVDSTTAAAQAVIDYIQAVTTPESLVALQ